MKINHFFAAALCGLALSACTPTEPPSGAKNSLAVLAQNVPTFTETGNIDIVALREIYLALNPDRYGMPLYKFRRQGFRLNPDGTTVRYGAFNANGELFHTTEILSYENGELCMDQQESWSGACFSAAFTPEGRIAVTYKFGNNKGGTYIVSDL